MAYTSQRQLTIEYVHCTRREEVVLVTHAAKLGRGWSVLIAAQAGTEAMNSYRTPVTFALRLSFQLPLWTVPIAMMPARAECNFSHALGSLPVCGAGQSTAAIRGAALPGHPGDTSPACYGSEPSKHGGVRSGCSVNPAPCPAYPLIGHRASRC